MGEAKITRIMGWEIGIEHTGFLNVARMIEFVDDEYATGNYDEVTGIWIDAGARAEYTRTNNATEL